MANSHDKHFDELEVEETTPQGTQENGVDKGHDERDVDLGAILRWFMGLAALAAVAILGMWGMFVFLAKREEVKDIVPSPLFVAQRQPQPPEPRLLPSPWEAGAKERQSENKRLVAIGLLNPKTGLPTIPASAMNIGNQPSGSATGTGMSGVRAGQRSGEQMPRPMLPTDWSGGRKLEVRKQ
jgi:hypothetical protein